MTLIILKDKYIVFAAGTDGNFMLVKYRNLSFSFKFINQSYLFLYTPDHYIKQEMVCRKSFASFTGALEKYILKFQKLLAEAF